MYFFDCNGSVGISVVNHENVNHENFIVLEKISFARTANDYIEYMDACGIDKAVVWHQAMYDMDPAYGNQKLDKEVAGHEDRLVKSWAILPEITDDDFKLDDLLGRMKDNNVKLLRAYPEQNRYFMNRLTMGRMLDAFVEHKIPLFLSPMFGYEYLYKLMEEYPDLRVVICNIGLWGPSRFLYPLVKGYKNVYFETGDYQMIEGIRDACEKLGSEKLLFGTNFPVNNMGGAKYALMTAEISEAERGNIAHLNLERLISEVRL